MGIEQTVPRTFAVSGVTLPLDTARAIAGAVLVVAMLALVVATWLGRVPGDDVAALFAARHAPRILRVSALPSGTAVVDVEDAEALHRVAERLDGLVLHHEGPGGSTFAVRDGDTTYRWAASPAESRPDDGRRPRPPPRLTQDTALPHA